MKLSKLDRAAATGLVALVAAGLLVAAFPRNFAATWLDLLLVVDLVVSVFLFSQAPGVRWAFGAYVPLALTLIHWFMLALLWKLPFVGPAWLLFLILAICAGAFWGQILLPLVSGGRVRKEDKTERPSAAPDLTGIPLGNCYAVLTQGKGKIVFPEEVLASHACFLGSPGTGKTSGFMMHMFDELASRRAGMFLWDAKGNMHGKFERLVAHNGRQGDYWHFDLENDASPRINPLYGRDPEIVSEIALAGFFPDRAFTGPASFYTDTHAAYFKNLTRLLLHMQETVTFEDYWQFTTNLDALKSQAKKFNHERWGQQLIDLLGRKELRKQLEGLSNRLDPLVTPSYAKLLNTRKPDLTIHDLVDKGQILTASVYSGRYKSGYIPVSLMMMYALETEMADRHSPKKKVIPFFVFLDEAAALLGKYPDFGQFLNKAREAKVGIFYGLQTLADIQLISETHFEQFMANTRVKVIFNPNHQGAAEYFSKLIGTEVTYTQVYSYSSEGGGHEAGYTLKPESKYLVNPDEIRNLQERQAILFLPYMKTAALLTKVQYPSPTVYDYPEKLTYKNGPSGLATDVASPNASGVEPVAPSEAAAPEAPVPEAPAPGEVTPPAAKSKIKGIVKKPKAQGHYRLDPGVGGALEAILKNKAETDKSSEL